MCLKYNFKKMCCFYVSLIHLVTMILPYINKSLEEEKEIITILEQDLQENVEKLLSRMNLNEEKKNKILKINWKTNTNINVENSNKKKIILIVGKNEFVEKINRKILNQKIVPEYSIINCYDFNEEKESIKEILDNHDKILNTLGEREIEEVFVGYRRVTN